MADRGLSPGDGANLAERLYETPRYSGPADLAGRL
jgi:hypothetical protein